jgi:hypothetical protein
MALFPKALAVYSGFHLGEARCDHPPSPPLTGLQRETLTARRWGVGLSNSVSHSIENRYSKIQVSSKLSPARCPAP